MSNILKFPEKVVRMYNARWAIRRGLLALNNSIRAQEEVTRLTQALDEQLNQFDIGKDDKIIE